MNGLIWIGQVALACVFLTTGTLKLLAYGPPMQAVESRTNLHVSMAPMRSRIIGFVEVVLAFGVLIPDMYTPDGMAPEYLIARCCAAGLALLMVGAAVHHVRRREPTAAAVATFLLALFVIVGRWPY
ncbi:MAG TPA: DoxX family protein [Terracidiphilus sp.]|nr:DoxX family protein [Terracidiphilus sp.]